MTAMSLTIPNDLTIASSDPQLDASSPSSTYVTPPTLFLSPVLAPQPSQKAGASDAEDIPPLNDTVYATEPRRRFPNYQLGKATWRLRGAHILSHSAMRWRESGGRCSSWLPRLEHRIFSHPYVVLPPSQAPGISSIVPSPSTRSPSTDVIAIKVCIEVYVKYD
ncbi:hypothetical protein NP233_g12296 [Leucocoprinus birnbaumii]|uniref:Uncharacterized protein n=1 Tax=Leucocoprinus birnbaumii TaxID=56174 RepID=A0AAD5YKJ4_9AGAR|nr:hypothetical protein NP233_g12296 [Leucocoprinus birnbaumii]